MSCWATVINLLNTVVHYCWNRWFICQHSAMMMMMNLCKHVCVFVGADMGKHKAPFVTFTAYCYAGIMCHLVMFGVTCLTEWELGMWQTLYLHLTTCECWPLFSQFDIQWVVVSISAWCEYFVLFCSIELYWTLDGRYWLKRTLSVLSHP